MCVCARLEAITSLMPEISAAMFGGSVSTSDLGCAPGTQHMLWPVDTTLWVTILKLKQQQQQT